jgi:hypothetical protein
MFLGFDDGGATEVHSRAVAGRRSSGIDALQSEERTFQLVEGILSDSFDQGRKRHAGRA